MQQEILDQTVLLARRVKKAILVYLELHHLVRGESLVRQVGQALVDHLGFQECRELMADLDCQD